MNISNKVKSVKYVDNVKSLRYDVIKINYTSQYK